MSRGEDKAPVRIHPVRDWPKSLHRPEVLHSGDQAVVDPPLPPLRFPSLSQHGVPAAVPIWDRGQLQVWSQASGHQEAQGLDCRRVSWIFTSFCP